jgi:hypothetical protein
VRCRTEVIGMKKVAVPIWLLSALSALSFLFVLFFLLYVWGWPECSQPI